ncbi:MAG: hypothetical protein K2Y30_02620 [Flavobacteriaceae bacterium]|nr:hypothetical protein [Flavobacteriaceae bacterium]
MKITILILLTFFGLSSNALAYPISPRPLRQLVSESQYIIVGYVVKTFDNKKDKDDWGSKIARIAVLQNLQGEIKKDTIEIEFNPNMICPAPARYFDSTFVIAFVDKDKKSGKFQTHALNYGSKTLKKKEIEIYKQRISEIQQILKISDKENQFSETVEWLVKCTENETTRWEGTFELSPESNFMSFYSQDKKQNFKSIINSSQKERLKKALLNSNEMVDFGLVDLVYKDNEAQIDDFLFSKLKNLEKDEYWIADNFMNRLKHKSDSKDMNALLEEFDKIQFEYDKNEEKKNIIKKFIILIEK